MPGPDCPRVLLYGHIVSESDGAAGEPALAVFMPAPHSFTGEDVAEIHCHGGSFAARRALRLALHAGARLAQNGEFTRRAFLNGKLDLTQTLPPSEWLDALLFPWIEGGWFVDPAAGTLSPKLSGAERKLFLRLERKAMDRAMALLALSAGEVPVYMHIPEEKITLLCPRENWCTADETCLSRLQEALGAENVILKEKG